MAQRPLLASVELAGPFEVQKQRILLTPKEARPGSSGPLAWWKFDETAGDLAANAAGNKYEARIQGPPRWGPGCDAAGQALEFDGLKNWVQCPDSGLLDFRQGVALSLRFKVRAFDRPGQILASKGNVWRLNRQGEKGTLEFALDGLKTKKRPPAVVFTKRRVDDGAWHHVIACYDGKRVALYLDGVEEDALPATGAVTLTSLPVTLGENEASPGQRFNGWMDDVRLYARGLSADEIQSLNGKTQP